MLFQTLDIKNECVGYYANGEFYRLPPDFSLTKTWDYSADLRSAHVEYARIYANGKTLTEVCPPRYKNMWERVKEQLQAYLKSFHTAKLDMDDICFFDAVPEYFLFEFCDIKNEISRDVFTNLERPENHDFMADVLKLIGDIRQQPLNIDVDPIRSKLGSLQGRNFMKRLQKVKWVCDYNPWGTVTGRLAGVPNTFPLMTLNKDFRGCLHPRNDWFVELDYNAAEVRTLLALSEQEQPTEDIHEWNNHHIYGGKLSRSEAKQKIFSWLYSKRGNKNAEKYYNKEKVLEKYWDGQAIVTEFDRCIKRVDNHHALNYIIQSTTSDLVLSKAVAINERLRHKKSNVAFMLHDSIIIDLDIADRYMIPELTQKFSATRFGDYKVNLSAGKNFGEMRELKL